MDYLKYLIEGLVQVPKSYKIIEPVFKENANAYYKALSTSKEKEAKLYYTRDLKFAKTCLMLLGIYLVDSDKLKDMFKDHIDDLEIKVSSYLHVPPEYITTIDAEKCALHYLNTGDKSFLRKRASMWDNECDLKLTSDLYDGLDEELLRYFCVYDLVKDYEDIFKLKQNLIMSMLESYTTDNVIYIKEKVDDSKYKLQTSEIRNMYEDKIYKLSTENAMLENKILKYEDIIKFYESKDNLIEEEEESEESNSNNKQLDIDLNSMKGIVVGGWDSWVALMKERLPNWEFTYGEMITEYEIKDKDIIILNPRYVGHGQFYKIQSVIATRPNIKFGYIKHINVDRAIDDIKEVALSG